MSGTSDPIPEWLNEHHRAPPQPIAPRLLHRSAWSHCGANCLWYSIVAKRPLQQWVTFQPRWAQWPRPATVSLPANSPCLCVFAHAEVSGSPASARSPLLWLCVARLHSATMLSPEGGTSRGWTHPLWHGYGSTLGSPFIRCHARWPPPTAHVGKRWGKERKDSTDRETAKWCQQKSGFMLL